MLIVGRVQRCGLGITEDFLEDDILSLEDGNIGCSERVRKTSGHQAYPKQLRGAQIRSEQYVPPG